MYDMIFNNVDNNKVNINFDYKKRAFLADYIEILTNIN